MTRVYAQNRKQLFQLTEKLGEGGEGTVFAWPSDEHRVCKIYHDGVLQERGDALARKLTAMLAAPPDDPMHARGSPTFAWPEELVFDAANHKRLVGFVMPRIRDSHSLHRLYSSGDRKQLVFPPDREGRPLPEYYVMVATARNLAEAFRLLHARGYVMADVNEDNIRFRTDATVSLIDNDSFQVRDRSTGENFLVPVLKVEYWPADSLEIHDRGQVLATTHDQFCLALFLFRLMMNGVHPYHGMGAPGADPPSPAENIAAGRFPFMPVHSGGLRPPLHAPAFDGLPAELRELFRSSFVAGARDPSARADAGTWVKVLDRAQSTLKRCQRGHTHFAEAHQCPWCELEDALVVCSKNSTHKKYYRAQGSCPQCMLEQRRAARSSAPAAARPAGAYVPVQVRNAPQPTAVSVPAPAVTRQAAAVLPGISALKRSPMVTRWWIFDLLVALFVGACIWGPNHLFGGGAGTSNAAAAVGDAGTTETNSAGAVSKPAHVKVTGSKAVNPQDGAAVVLIPPGSFKMGDRYQDDNPRHTVTLSGYWMYKNDVTVAMYKKFCKATGNEMPEAPDFDKGWSQEDHPIVNVSWDDATDYCKWAGVSLPTEAQWEKAARGTDGRMFPWGNEWDASKCANSAQSLSGTVAVGHYTDNPYGLSDMAGNVRQWCADWYDSSKSSRVLRGGSWNDHESGHFHAAYRFGDSPYYYRDADLGFRCAAGQ